VTEDVTACDRALHGTSLLHFECRHQARVCTWSVTTFCSARTRQCGGMSKRPGSGISFLQ
jgi:hypothetical protein